MIERREGRQEPERLKVRLGEPFSMPKGERSVGFETDSGHKGNLCFQNYWYVGRKGERARAVEGLVEVREIRTIDSNGHSTHDGSYPIYPEIDFYIDSEELGIFAESDPYMRFEDYEKERELRRSSEEAALEQLKMEVKASMTFRNVKYMADLSGFPNRMLIKEGFIPRGERDRHFFARANFTWWDKSQERWRRLLFPKDPEILSEIQFVVDIPSLRAKQE